MTQKNIGHQIWTLSRFFPFSFWYNTLITLIASGGSPFSCSCLSFSKLILDLSWLHVVYDLSDLFLPVLLFFLSPLWFLPPYLTHIIHINSSYPLKKKKKCPYILCLPPPATLCLIFKRTLLTYDFTNHKIHLLKVYNSMAVSIFTQLLNHHSNLIFEHLYHPQNIPLIHL